MKHDKYLDAAFRLNLFSTDFMPLIETMNAEQLEETASGLKAILALIKREPARRIEDAAEKQRRQKSLEMREWIKKLVVSE